MMERDLRERILRAGCAGWKFEDSRLTPGVPRMVAIDPEGRHHHVWKLGWVMYPIADQMAELDAAGVPA